MLKALLTGGGRVEIDTNIHLDELLEIMNTQAFGPLLHNTHSLTMNGAEIAIDSFRNIVVWHTKVSGSSAAST